MSLVPRTLKGKILAASIALAALFTVAVALLVVFWAWLSYVLAAAFALYGALITLAGTGLAAYLVWRRHKLTALRLDWTDREAQSHS